MAVSLEATVKVGVRPLRQALTAVTPHAEPTKSGDEISAQARVRLIAGKEELHVVATCTHTSGMASIPIEEDSRSIRFAPDDGPIVVDIPPGVARSVLADFKGSRSTADGIQEWVDIELGAVDDVGRDVITITDVSALFPGLRITIPVLATSAEFPDVVGILADAMREASGPGSTIVVGGRTLALFRHASVAYGEPLQLCHTGQRGYLVTCGAAFLGHLSSRHGDDDSLHRRDRDYRAHMVRMGLTAPVQAAG